MIGTGGQSSQGDKVLDPTIFTLAYKENRFYLFTNREPLDIDDKKNEKIDKNTLMKRDVINEKPSKEEAQMLSQSTSSVLANQVYLINHPIGCN